MKNRIELEDELKLISSLLAERKKENLFAVPENYFSSVEENVMEKIHTESVGAELKNASLIGFNKQYPFNVPYGYFERLPNEILNKTTRKKPYLILDNAFNYFQYSFRFSHLFAATPMVAVLILAILFLIKPVDVIETHPQQTQMSSDEISNYLSDNISTLDESLLVAQMNEHSISKLTTGIEQEAAEYDASLIDATQISIEDIQNL